jgi:ABC-2 type transport system ATP-binding protein
MGLKLENVNKSYGSKKVVNNISFEMDKPGVFGLLGSNGAGKTTTIRMILGILNSIALGASAGRAVVVRCHSSSSA